jgi:hypothetical protein
VQTQVAQLMLRTEYREQRQHIFPSQPSLDWFVRKHRAGLVEAGALLMLTGRWFFDAEKFDAYMILTGGKAAKAQTADTAE